MPINLLQKQDLAASSFTNNNSNAAGGVEVNVAAAGKIATAITTNASDLNTAVKTAIGQMPSSAFGFNPDDVIEGANAASFPATGQTSALYYATDNNHVYRWSGSAYIDITAANAAGAATNTVAGIVALNDGMGAGDATNATDALTAAGFNALAGNTGTANDLQTAIGFAAAKAAGGTLTNILANDGTTVLFRAYI